MPGGRSTSQERVKIDIIKRNIENVKANSQKSNHSSAISSQNSTGYTKLYKNGKSNRRSQSQKRLQLKEIEEVQETKENKAPVAEEKINTEILEIVPEIVNLAENIVIEPEVKPSAEEAPDVFSILSPTPLSIRKSLNVPLSERKRLSLSAPKVSFPISEKDEEIDLKRKRMSANGEIETNDTEHVAKKAKVNNE